MGYIPPYVPRLFLLQQIHGNPAVHGPSCSTTSIIPNPLSAMECSRSLSRRDDRSMESPPVSRQYPLAPGSNECSELTPTSRDRHPPGQLYSAPEKGARSCSDANSPSVSIESRDSGRSGEARFLRPVLPDGRGWSSNRKHGLDVRNARCPLGATSRIGNGLPGCKKSPAPRCPAG